MFWTMSPTEDDPRESVTLCEHHALEETNAAMLVTGMDAFGSMDECYAVMTALCATAGFDYGLTGSEIGSCEMCENETAQSAPLEESA